jgi:hypothetical protein
LDVDDRNGEGPETITVLGVLPGTYRYYVHDYSNRDNAETTALARSDAEVKVYHGGQTYRFRAGHDMVGNIWNVCTLEVTKTGAALVEKVNTFEARKSESLGLYEKRTMGDRDTWIGEIGGSRISEASVRDGLEWLARHQADDGSWGNYCLGQKRPQAKCEPDAPCTGPGDRHEMAQTGLAILAFQAGGHYYFNENVYSDRVRRALDWMVANQGSDGALVTPGLKPYAEMNYQSPFHRYYMYEHGIAAFALAEACAVAVAMGHPESDRYRDAAERAVRFIEGMQHNDGGWRYTPRMEKPGDTSVTGWQVLALKSAREAGIPVSYECIDKIREYFESRKTGENGRTGYYDRHPHTEATTGVGMFARQFLLGEPDAQLVRDAAVFLADYADRQWGGLEPDARKSKNFEPDFYLWYNCTLAMFQAGGEPWQRWNRVVRDTVIDLQRHDGCCRGSWDPNSKWGKRGGRIYSTALAVLTLEVYYRYASHDEAADAFTQEMTSRDPDGGPVGDTGGMTLEVTGRNEPQAGQPESQEGVPSPTGDSNIELNVRGEDQRRLEPQPAGPLTPPGR